MRIPSRAACVLAVVASLAMPTHARDSTAPAAAMQGDAERPAEASQWQRAELYFGLGRTDGPDSAAYAARWQAFLDEEVTPRFPDGFSVVDVYGQWQRREPKTIERLNSKLLVILIEGGLHRDDLDALRAAWKQRTGDQSVLLSLSPAEVSF